MVNQMHRAKGKGYLKWTPHVPNLPTAALTTPQKVYFIMLSLCSCLHVLFKETNIIRTLKHFIRVRTLYGASGINFKSI